jgi:hypothetical protein
VYPGEREEEARKGEEDMRIWGYGIDNTPFQNI